MGARVDQVDVYRVSKRLDAYSYRDLHLISSSRIVGHVN